MLAIQITPQFVFRGVLEGLVFGLVAIGLVLIYRSSRIINFAEGQIGAFAALLMASVAYNYHIPFGIGLPLAIATGAALGAAIELLVIRRLFYQPRLLLFVATLGVSQLLLYLAFRLPEIKDRVRYPELFNLSKPWHVGPIDIQGDQLAVLIFVPIVCIVLFYLLNKTSFGQAVRASADNPSAASLAGISVKALSTQVWILAGGLSAFSAVLFGPLSGEQPTPSGNALGPSLLVSALAAAMVGGLESFPLALAGGIGIGVVETLIRLNTRTAGAEYVFVFGLLLILVLVRGASAGEEGGWSLPKAKAAAQHLAQLPIVRWLNRAIIAVAVAVALLVPFLLHKGADEQRYSLIPIFLIVALSSTVLTGWAGQLSLGQFAFVGIGAYATSYYSTALPYPVSLAIGVGIGVGVAIAIGLPALRVRGLNLAIITLAFQLLCSYWLFGLPKLNNGVGGTQARLGHRSVFRSDIISDKRSFYLVCLAAVVVVMFIVTRLRRSGVGRSLIAVRENENSAAAFTVSPMRAKLIAFAVSGGIASFAGGLYAGWGRSFSNVYFAPEESLRIVSIAVVGGIASITGAVLGTLVVEGLPVVFNGNDQVKLFASSVGMLLLLMYFPGGLISMVQNVRDLLYGWLAKRKGIETTRGPARTTVAALSSRPKEAPSAVLPLETHDVTVRFGGLIATNRVSITVDPGEVVGLIGTNGAGKTTFMNAVSGFLTSTGQINVYGTPVNSAAGYRRARLGLGRAFQNARLFPALTARETVMVALEGPLALIARPITALRCRPHLGQEARKRREAAEIMDYLGLGHYADTHHGRAVDGHPPDRRARRPHRLRLEAPPARRADRGRRSEGDRGVRPAHPLYPARARRVDPHHRARHAAGHVDQRPHLLPRGRRRHRRGTTARCAQ